MATHTVAEQQRFLIQWFRTWSEFQKEDFTQIVVHKLNPSHFINGLLANGIQNLNAGNAEASLGRPPSLFTCQMKLYNEWWDSWKQDDKDAFTTSLKDSDPKFWVAVEEELAGNRNKRDEEFLAIITNANGNGDTEIVQKSDEVPSDVINDQIVSNINIITTTAVKVDLAVHNVEDNVGNGNGHAEEQEAEEEEVQPAPENSTSNGGPKPAQEPQRVQVGTGEGVLVIEEDNDEII